MTEPEDGGAIDVAEEFARTTAAAAAQWDHELHVRAARNAHGQALARIWAVVVAAGLALLFAFIAFVVFQVTSSHARVAVEHERQEHDKVTVWCFADPNDGGRSTSSFTGSRQNVEGICPDSHAAP